MNNKIRLLDSEWQSPNNLNEQYSINDEIKTTLDNKNRKQNKISNPQPAEFDGRLASSVAIILDEIRSVLSCMTSVKTNGVHIQTIANILRKTILEAKLTIELNADLEVDKAVPYFFSTLFEYKLSKFCSLWETSYSANLKI